MHNLQLSYFLVGGVCMLRMYLSSFTIGRRPQEESLSKLSEPIQHSRCQQAQRFGLSGRNLDVQNPF